MCTLLNPPKYLNRAQSDEQLRSPLMDELNRKVSFRTLGIWRKQLTFRHHSPHANLQMRENRVNLLEFKLIWNVLFRKSGHLKCSHNNLKSNLFRFAILLYRLLLYHLAISEFHPIWEYRKYLNAYKTTSEPIFMRFSFFYRLLQ